MTHRPHPFVRPFVRPPRLVGKVSLIDSDLNMIGYEFTWAPQYRLYECSLPLHVPGEGQIPSVKEYDYPRERCDLLPIVLLAALYIYWANQ